MKHNNEITIKSGAVMLFETDKGTVKIKFRVKTFNAVAFKIEAPKAVEIHRLESYKDFTG